MTTALSIDEMKADLESRGYRFASFRVFAPDGWNYVPEISDENLDIETLKTELKSKRVKKAWQHYQEQQELIALRELVAKVAAERFTVSILAMGEIIKSHRKDATDILARFAKPE